jgi:hypothetical protein
VVQQHGGGGQPPKDSMSWCAAACVRGTLASGVVPLPWQRWPGHNAGFLATWMRVDWTHALCHCSCSACITSSDSILSPSKTCTGSVVLLPRSLMRPCTRVASETKAPLNHHHYSLKCHRKLAAPVMTAAQIYLNPASPMPHLSLCANAA